MKINTETRIINLSLIAGMVILIFCSIVARHQIQQMAKANAWVIHTYRVINTTDLLLLDLTDAESRLSFYVLTKDKAAIQNLPVLIKEVQQSASLLIGLTKDNPIQHQRTNELIKLVEQKLSLMQQIISAGKVAKNNMMQTVATSKERMETKQKIRAMVNDINTEEFNLLIQRDELTNHEMKISNTMLIIFGVFSELFLLLSLILLNYNLQKRIIAESKRAETEKELIQINKNLQKSEERYQLTTEGSGVGLWDWEVGTDKVYYSNYFKKMLGYSNSEFPDLMQSFEKIIHPLDHDRTWRLVDQHLEHHIPFKTEYRLRLKSGRYIWVQATGLAVWNNAGKPTRMSGSIIDISDRKKAEQRLSIQYSVNELLSEAANLEAVAKAIIREICHALRWEFGALWKLDTVKNQLVSVDVWHHSSPLLKVFEAETRKEKLEHGKGLLGHVWEKGEPAWFTDIDKNSIYTRARAAKKAGLRSAFLFPIKMEKAVLGVIECYTPEYEPLDKNILDLMQTIGFQIGQFIQRKATEHDLRESEGYKTAILEAVTDCILTVDKNNNILSLNSQTLKEFFYPRTELMGKNLQSILPEITAKLVDLSPMIGAEILGLNKNGATFPIEMNVSTMELNQEIIAVVILRNITERKRVEKIKNEFVSVVSHELRTPLTSIRGALGLMIGGVLGEFPEKALRLLELANNNCERLLLLINDILDIEKLEAGKMQFDYQVVDICQLVNEAIEVNKMYAKKFGVNLVLAAAPACAKVNVDAHRLIQVLTNLISNAVKFSTKGEEVILAVKQSHNSVRVLVSNKGPGVPVEFQSRIFQKFSQADSSDTRSKGGTGLGLHITKSIIERLGGTINFISKPNEVTTFYFDLAIYEPSTKKIAVQKSQSVDKILICEDDEDQAKYLETLLENAGFDVDIANNVHQAKKLLQDNTYHVVLLDLILPDQDGISFIRELRSNKKTSNLPIIVLSVIAQTGRNLLSGEALTVIDWLDKPINFDKLLSAIQRVKNKTYPNLPNILHVEDDVETFKFVKSLLNDNAKVHSATSLRETIEQVKNKKFDLIILDLLLPDGNAESILPLIAEYNLPIIVYSTNALDKKFSAVVRHRLLKSETSNEKLLSLIKNVLETNT